MNLRDGWNIIQQECHESSRKAGWWPDKLQKNEELTLIPTKLCLIHSEISEAMEGYRKDQMDDKLPHRKAIEVELADAVIRIADLAGFLHLDVGGAIDEKMSYNQTREDHKPEVRAAQGGKKF